MTKNVITKETIAKDLQTEDKKSSRILLIVALVYMFVGSSVLLAVYFLGLKNSEIGAIGYVIFFACVFICLLPLLFFISLLIPRRNGQNNSNFFVITDEVVYKEEKTIRRRDTRLIKKVIHFYQCGEIEVNSTWYQITAERDVFYMVVRDRNSKSALKCYPAKLYEYIE
ncbi:MAG: hypothetical protein J6Q82_05935 [Clostridia bacterium]|nr:hypothetical protein [Clostridia bacterium]